MLVEIDICYFYGRKTAYTDPNGWIRPLFKSFLLHFMLLLWLLAVSPGQATSGERLRNWCHYDNTKSPTVTVLLGCCTINRLGMEA